MEQTREIEVVEEIDFEDQVLRQGGQVVVAFMAEWSGPCRMLAPILTEALTERAGPRVVKVDVDQATVLVAKLKISGLPALVGFRDGVRVESIVGTFSKGDLHRFLDLLSN